MTSSRDCLTTVKVRLGRGTRLPKYETSGAAGVDLSARKLVLIPRWSFRPVPTGVYLELPEGLEAQIRPRSGLACKHGISVLNSPGTIDTDYRGEIVVVLFNIGNESYTVRPGDRIAQIVFSQVVRVQLKKVKRLKGTPRGRRGFGHTGY